MLFPRGIFDGVFCSCALKWCRYHALRWVEVGRGLQLSCVFNSDVHKLIRRVVLSFLFDVEKLANGVV